MINYSPNKNKKSLKKTIISLVLIIILIFVVFSFIIAWQKNHQINNEITDLKDQISNMETENYKLSDLIKYLNSNAFIEEKARVDLGFKKEGEKVVLVPDNIKNNIIAVENQNQSDKSIQDLSNPQKWWKYFFSK